VVVLGDSTLCNLLVKLEVAIPDSDRTLHLFPPEQVDTYGPSADSGTLTFRELNPVRAYLRLPHLHEESVKLEGYSTDNAGFPAFGVAQWEGRQVLFKAIEHRVDETGKAVEAPRYVLLEATAAQLAESSKRQHHLHSGEIRQNAVLGWFERDV
jgi:hypothetical protein